MPTISPARKTAFDLLMAVERGQSHSDDLLRRKSVNALPAPDRNLATALVLGVLRWQIRLDHQLQALMTRPNARLDPEILIALRLGAFQLLHLDRIPARAAIDESVELAKQAGHRYASGMVNAVLRKLASAPRFDFLEESAGELALAEAHPTWMVERWANFYGLESTRAICRHGQSQPALTVRIESPAVEAELTQAGIRLEPGELLTAARAVIPGDITATPAFHEGRVRLQDEGSQLVAELAALASDSLVEHGSAIPARSILDACAAPGGKTLILAERNPQARILACETSPPRLEQLRTRLGGLGERIECRLADATALTEDQAFDLALADVPCSGTGTLGRNPEIRHRLRPEDLPRQAERQRAILQSALRAVRPGGRVVYSTCSLEPEENEQVVAAVLAAIPNARPISLEARIEALLREGILTPSGAERLHRCFTTEGALRLLPGAFHTDGFFIALVERTA
ncbi:MAG TPA: 16S rRNA (cytosine(967)-C(5))-methyltransferase RsmB [Terracidiphilus sp.]|nr:16S rRNA (cytosine(967)-C(5))-methyltransferase RsmB [Terracidiphilus sp.]